MVFLIKNIVEQYKKKQTHQSPCLPICHSEQNNQVHKNSGGCTKMIFSQDGIPWTYDQQKKKIVGM